MNSSFYKKIEILIRIKAGEFKKAPTDAKLKLIERKQLEILSKNKKIQKLARVFIENKINQIKAEKLAKDPNDPIGKIPMLCRSFDRA